MLMLSGILGLLQSTLLPGLLMIRVCRLKGGITEQILRLIPLSLLANYLLIFFLAAVGAYTRPVMLVIIAAEILLLLWLYRDTLLRPVGETVFRVTDALRAELLPLAEFLTERPLSLVLRLRRWAWAVCGCFALSGVLWGFHLCRLNFGTIFSGWDTLFSWNAYAEIWSGGKIPNIGGLYPQLIPANWSLSYLLQGEGAVQFFNTLIPPLFFLLIQVMLFDLGFQRRQSGFFIAAVIARFMMKKLMGDQLFDGYMDVPAACMILLSIYTYIRAEGRALKDQRQAVMLGVLFAAEAAVTKQSGSPALIIAPLAVFLLLRKAQGEMSRKQKILTVLSVLIIVLPWYLHCFLFNTHGEAREIIASGIVDYNQQYDIHHRLWQADQIIGKYGLCFLIGLIGLPFVNKRHWILFSLLVWPQTVIWAVNYSYDARNLAPVLPFVSMLAGLAIAGIADFIARLAGKKRMERIPLAVLIFIAAAAAAVFLVRLYPDSRLSGDQRVQQKALFGERLNNELLYDVFGESHSGNDIYTDYPARLLPGYRDCCSSAELTDEIQVRQVLEGDKINWLLLPVVMPNNSDPSKELIEQCIAEGKCGQVRCSDGYYKAYCLYEIKR